MNESIAIVKKDACFGCTACMAICQYHAIEMRADTEGFMAPEVNAEKCVRCGACTRVCPALNSWSRKDGDNKFFAFQNENEQILAKSTSGGAFSAIVASEKKPYVCGCILDDELYVRHVLARDEAEIAAMRGSKYVQSDMGNCLWEIKEKLLANEVVIFSGTSCQVHGLLNYLEAGHVPTEKLITIDLICHGVPSNLMHQEYVRNYEQVKGVKREKHYFRSKRQGWGLRFMFKNYEQVFAHSGLCEDWTSLESQLWINIFFSELCLREVCYRCPYCTDGKPADITLADFWGIEQTDLDFEFSKGCSLIIARGKGLDKVKNLANVVELNVQQETTARKYQSLLKTPIKRPADRDAFWKDYHENGFLYVAKKYLHYSRKYKMLITLYNIAKYLNERVAQRLGMIVFY